VLNALVQLSKAHGQDANNAQISGDQEFLLHFNRAIAALLKVC